MRIAFHLFCVFCVFGFLDNLSARVLLTDHPFQLIERYYDKEAGGFDYRAVTIVGTERQNNSLNRLSIISEDQFDYPYPESGCGPTALLNILVWYEKYGLVDPISQDANDRSYKYQLFEHIDGLFADISGASRATVSGTRVLDAALVLDDMVEDGSDGKYRIHTDFVEAPLKLKNFLDVMPNFRAGYLIAFPKSAKSGRLQQRHALTVIRADRSGYLTLGTWGQIYHGLLRDRPDGQWFIPSNPEHLEMKIVGLMRFIPFEPAELSGEQAAVERRR